MSVMSLIPALAFWAFCLCRDLTRLALEAEAFDDRRAECFEFRDGTFKGEGKTCSPASIGVTGSSSSHSSHSSRRRGFVSEYGGGCTGT